MPAPRPGRHDRGPQTLTTLHGPGATLEPAIDHELAAAHAVVHGALATGALVRAAGVAMVVIGAAVRLAEHLVGQRRATIAP